MARDEMDKTRTALMFRSLAFTAAIGHLLSSSCSTTQVEPMVVLPPEPPAYVAVPHPEGLDYADVLEIFTDAHAPSLDSLRDCDSVFQKLRTTVESRDELDEGTVELIRLDPIKYHWCFYGKIVSLEDRLKADAYLDEKQKAVLDAYSFVTPMAKAYLKEYNDSRYLRWAIARYKKASEYVFFKKLDTNPKTTQMLASATNPFGHFKAMMDQKVDLKYGVLEKYKLLGLEGNAQATYPNPEAQAAAIPTAGSTGADAMTSPTQPAVQATATTAPETLPAVPALPAPPTTAANATAQTPPQTTPAEAAPNNDRVPASKP